MLLNGISAITISGFSACICPASLTSQLGHHHMSCGTIMVLPCSTQVEAFWSNSDQNGLTIAKMIRMRSTARTPSTAASGCAPRARSNCMAVPMPPNSSTAPSARQNEITKPKPSGHQAGDSAHPTSSATAIATPAIATRLPAPLPSLPPRSAVLTTFMNECGSAGAGGMFTYFARPIQKMTVAMNISTPGMPKAIAGPYSRRKIGISSEAKNEPKLIVQ